jgi:hypothetical protein
MKQASRSGWLIVLLAAIGFVCALGLGVVGYWRYAASVPPFKPQLPPMPKPNGYERAAKAAGRLSRAIHPPYPPHWPSGMPAELRAQLAPVRSILDEIRATFRLTWRAPPVLRLGDEDSLQYGVYPPVVFWKCADCFVAESHLARSLGDYATAVQRGLDAIEFGSKSSWGCGKSARSNRVIYHQMGFRQVATVVSVLPQSAISGALERVRHVRSGWPPLSDMLESERIADLAAYTDYFKLLQREPFREQLNWLRDNQSSPSLLQTIRLGLTPRWVVLANMDRYYRERIAESKKPFRQRVSVPLPRDPWSPGGICVPPDLGDAWRWELAETELGLLEVALAVRMHSLEHGRYPVRLWEIDRRWLPSVPKDLWGQALTYRLQDGEPLIYSLGPDGRDDGAQAVDPRDLARTPPGDLVLRLRPTR